MLPDPEPHSNCQPRGIDHFGMVCRCMCHSVPAFHIMACCQPDTPEARAEIERFLNFIKPHKATEQTIKDGVAFVCDERLGGP